MWVARIEIDLYIRTLGSEENFSGRQAHMQHLLVPRSFRCSLAQLACRRRCAANAAIARRLELKGSSNLHSASRAPTIPKFIEQQVNQNVLSLLFKILSLLICTLISENQGLEKSRGCFIYILDSSNSSSITF